LIECDSVGLNAEQARELLYSINLAPYRGGKRVIILNDADSLSTVVANLLLKTLEEPRKDTFFFLVASNSSRLPIPVVSRCQNWRFPYLLDSEIREALIEIENPALIDNLAELANGSLEKIKDIESFVPQWQSSKKKLTQVLSGDSYSALSYASELAKDKDQIASNLSLIRLFIKSKLHEEREPAKQLILADSLENVLVAERLITERNLAPLSVLNLCLLGLSGNLPAQGRLISDIVV
jgi:DNA polymerase III delta prime subunit